MRNRSMWFVSVVAVSLCAVFVIGAAVPSAFAAPKGKPGVTPPGVPPGQPFQALQRQINALTTGLMWINPLAFVPGPGSTSTLGVVADPGLSVVNGAGGADVLQAGLQVPVGLAVTGSRVCYVPGAAVTPSAVSSVQTFQDPVPLDGAAVLVASGSPTTTTGTTVTCVDTPLTSSVAPSAGGALSLVINLSLTAGDPVVIRAVGLYLVPAP